MANILVLMELSRGAVVPASLEALGQARRLATALGATVYALLPLPEAPAYGEDDLIALCARHGADKVVLLIDERLSAEAEMRFGTHGPAVDATCKQLPPAVLLLGATRAARDLAPRLAARLGAAYLPEGWIDADGGRLVLHDRQGRPVLTDDEGGPDHTVVLTTPPGRYQRAHGEDEAEMIIVAAPDGDGDFSEVGHQAEIAWRVVGERGPLAGVLPPDAPSPSLVLGVAVEPPEVPGALRVALGPAAAEAMAAHYALAGEVGPTLAALAAALRPEAQ